MRDYRNNAKWLAYFAPFRALSISAAYLVPFFLEKGLNQSEIFLLQSVFSLTVVLLEVPSGWVADRIGRALSLQISAPLAAASMVVYGFSDHIWQFILCEMLLAVANVLFSGADQALLIDSLKAEGREDNYVRSAQRINSYGFAGIALGLPLSLLIVKHYGVSATIVADGIMTAIGALVVLRLVEPPVHEAEELEGANAWSATKQLLGNQQSRWLIAMTVVFGTSTYIGAWVAAPYFMAIGIPLAWFSVIYAGRALLKAWLSRHVRIEHRLKHSLGLFVLLAAVPYFAMAAMSPWLALALIGHDVVHALQSSPLAHRYNHFIASRYRAMLNSVVGLQTRLSYALVGPLAGLAIDKLGLQRGLLVIGLSFGVVAAFVYAQLVRLKALD